MKQENSSLIEVVERRTFLKVLGSAGPAVALAACSPIPPEKTRHARRGVGWASSFVIGRTLAWLAKTKKKAGNECSTSSSEVES